MSAGGPAFTFSFTATPGVTYISGMQTAARDLATFTLIALLSGNCAGGGAAHRPVALHTGYAYAFLATKAERLQDEDYYKAQRKWAKARKHYVRAYEQGVARLERRHPGFAAALEASPGKAVEQTVTGDVPLLYWTAAALGAAIGTSKDKPEWVIRLPQVGTLAHRVTELQPGYSGGAAYQLLMIYEASRPAMMGGSVKLAKHYYDQALNISGDQNAGLFVAYGESISVQEQDRETFIEMMNRALAIKGGGAVNRVARKRAKWLLGRIDDLFL